MTRRRPRAAAFLRTTIIPKLRGGSGEGAVAAPLPSARAAALLFRVFPKNSGPGA